MREIRYYYDRWYFIIFIVCLGLFIMNWKNELDCWGWWYVDVFYGFRKDDVLMMVCVGLFEIMIIIYEIYKNCRSVINMV